MIDFCWKLTKPKNQGSALVVSIILSTIVLSIGITSLSLVFKQIEFTADFVQSERAYFAAESGVEKALLELKREPVQWVENHTIPYENSEINLNIANQVSSFDITLNPQENTKFRLKRDTDPSFGHTLEDPLDFNITLDQADRFQWSILCTKLGGGTYSIQKIETARSTLLGVLTQRGTNNQPSPQNEDFNALRSVVDPQSCFFSLQNAGTQMRTFTFGALQKMTPNRAKIKSIGRSGSREKHIIFDYGQKNIGSLFDFSFFHTDQNL